MTTSTPQVPASAARGARPRPPLRRVRRGRWVAGALAGVAAHTGLPVWGVRLVALGLLAAGGAGLVGYLLLWTLVPLDDDGEGSGEGGAAGGEAHPADPLARWEPSGSAVTQLAVGVVALVSGVQLLLARSGAPGGGVLWVAVLVVTGVLVAWGQIDPVRRVRLLAQAGGGTPDGGRRVALGVALVAGGLVLLALGGAQAQALGPAAVAALAVVGGAALVVAPWATGLLRQLRAERGARVREAERAEVAAHLHDSVLQTLALLQRHADDPSAVTRLARRQERELRDWLYGGRGAREDDGDGAGASLAARVRAEAAAVEDAVGVAVGVVVVGDRPVDRAGDALAQALREAVLNAVRHGRPPVQVYLEAGPHGAEAYVRDHGDGFDPAAAAPDRMGVRESVLARMVRAGGSARVRPAPGGGTEVALSTSPDQPSAPSSVLPPDQPSVQEDAP